ncbi:MAG: DUF5333 domain-containing protein [Halocynthiibacter sp.]
MSMKMVAVSAMLVLGMVTVSAKAEARPHLRDVPELNDGLTAIAAANMIRKECATISPRMIKAYSYMRSLATDAQDMGYADDAIRKYVKNKAEKARVKGLARAYLVEQGVTLGNAQSYCSVGLKEIKAASKIGVLLKAK